jgi:multiple sugar transport system permease protein
VPRQTAPRDTPAKIGSPSRAARIARRRLSDYAVGLLVVIVLAIYLFPILYLVGTSLKTSGEALGIPPTVVPHTWSIDSYSTALTRYTGIGQAFINSIVIALLSTVISLVLAIPAAYAVTWFGSWVGRAFLVVALMSRMIPSVSVGIPLFLLLSRMGLYDTWLGVAIAHTTIGLPLCIWLLSGFFEGFPIELEEAARVDGCSRMGALVRIVLPLLAGGIGVAAIFAFLASWNELLFALLLTSTNAQTVPIAIANLNGQYGIEWGPMTALSVMFSLPVIALSLFVQKRIVAGMTMGAVKG